MNNSISTERHTKVYFQKQGGLSNLCGMHMINNYFGYPKYTTEMMNNVCYTLSSDCINPHKSILGGNYDVNVLMFIFQNEQIGLVYHDQRKDVQITSEQCGFIVNLSLNECCLFKCLDFGRHWIVFKRQTFRQKQRFVQFDSLNNGPIQHTRQTLLKKLKEYNKDSSTILKMVSKSKTQAIPFQ